MCQSGQHKQGGVWGHFGCSLETVGGMTVRKLQVLAWECLSRHPVGGVPPVNSKLFLSLSELLEGTG